MFFLYSFVGYLYVSGSGSITSVGEARELICLLLCTCNRSDWERTEHLTDVRSV